MNCEEAQALLHAYVDGELDVVNDLALTHHVHECQACARTYQAQRLLRSALRTNALAFAAPARLQRRLRSAVRQARQADAAPRAWAWWLGAAATLAAMLLLVWRMVSLPIGLAPAERVTQDIISGHVRSLMASHLTDILSSDQHTVKPWFDGKLEFSPPVYDLTADGFALLGGRLDYLDHRPVAALVYQRRQHVINLFLWPAAATMSVGEAQSTRQGYTLMHWTASGMVYWVISNLNPGELQAFVRLVQQHNTTSP